LQETFATSGNSSASETGASRPGGDPSGESGIEADFAAGIKAGLEFGNNNARSRSMPQVLQNSQPLRHEAPQ
jgi:hypothetical protein